MKTDAGDLFSSLSKVTSARKVSQASRYHTKSSQSESLGLTDKPSSETGKALKPEVNVTVSYLRPDWRIKRRLFSLKERTLLRIYVSKWFYQGLDYEERELLILLCESQKIDHDLLLKTIYTGTKTLTSTRELGEYDRTGEMEVRTSYSIAGDAIKAICLVGEIVLSRLSEELEMDFLRNNPLGYGELLDLVYSKEDFLAVWKLRSFQSLRDKLFAKFDRANSTGKLGVKKPRIRGYTDGRGSTGDPKRTKMAREVDACFWQEEHEGRWNDLFQDLNDLMLSDSGFLIPEEEG